MYFAQLILPLYSMKRNILTILLCCFVLASWAKDVVWYSGRGSVEYSFVGKRTGVVDMALNMFAEDMRAGLEDKHQEDIDALRAKLETDHKADIDALRAELETIKAQIAQQDEINDTAIQTLKSVDNTQQEASDISRLLTIIGLCIGSVALLGNVVLLVLLLKKKFLTK